MLCVSRRIIATLAFVTTETRIGFVYYRNPFSFADRAGGVVLIAGVIGPRSERRRSAKRTNLNKKKQIF